MPVMLTTQHKQWIEDKLKDCFGRENGVGNLTFTWNVDTPKLREIKGNYESGTCTLLNEPVSGNHQRAVTISVYMKRDQFEDNQSNLDVRCTQVDINDESIFLIVKKFENGNNSFYKFTDKHGCHNYHEYLKFNTQDQDALTGHTASICAPTASGILLGINQANGHVNGSYLSITETGTFEDRAVKVHPNQPTRRSRFASTAGQGSGAPSAWGGIGQGNGLAGQGGNSLTANRQRAPRPVKEKPTAALLGFSTVDSKNRPIYEDYTNDAVITMVNAKQGVTFHYATLSTGETTKDGVRLAAEKGADITHEEAVKLTLQKQQQGDEQRVALATKGIAAYDAWVADNSDHKISMVEAKNGMHLLHVDDEIFAKIKGASCCDKLYGFMPSMTAFNCCSSTKAGAASGKEHNAGAASGKGLSEGLIDRSTTVAGGKSEDSDDDQRSYSEKYPKISCCLTLVCSCPRSFANSICSAIDSCKTRTGIDSRCCSEKGMRDTNSYGLLFLAFVVFAGLITSTAWLGDQYEKNLRGKDNKGNNPEEPQVQFAEQLLGHLLTFDPNGIYGLKELCGGKISADENDVFCYQTGDGYGSSTHCSGPYQADPHAPCNTTGVRSIPLRARELGEPLTLQGDSAECDKDGTAIFKGLSTTGSDPAQLAYIPLKQGGNSASVTQNPITQELTATVPDACVNGEPKYKPTKLAAWDENGKMRDVAVGAVSGTGRTLFTAAPTSEKVSRTAEQFPTGNATQTL